MGKLTGFLILENGQTFEGKSVGFKKDIDGEVVFNTGMVGYPESFTDPSYYGQILVMTYPMIGNYGIPSNNLSQGISQNFESQRIQISGLVISNYINNLSHWQARQTLDKWLISDHVPALTGIDTRKLTQIIREYGVMNGRITFQIPPEKIGGFSFHDLNQNNLVASVSTKKKLTFGSGKIKLLVIDCGMKINQIRILLRYDVTLIIVPWNYNPFEGNKIKFDGIFITNGPGDPKVLKETINYVKEALKRRIPTMGICLGHQVLGLAAGADTYKLKFGHRSQNQPVIDELTGKCYITTQNHGFAVDAETIPAGWKCWFTNLNDSTCEGIRHNILPFISCQFHPEAAPGPTDTEWIFDYFIKLIAKWKNQKRI